MHGFEPFVPCNALVQIPAQILHEADVKDEATFDLILSKCWASFVDQLVKNPPAMWRPGFDPWVGKIPWRRERLPTPVFWPGESHGLYSSWVCKQLDRTEQLSLHWANVQGGLASHEKDLRKAEEKRKTELVSNVLRTGFQSHHQVQIFTLYRHWTSATVVQRAAHQSLWSCFISPPSFS